MFAIEPTIDSPLFGLPNVVVTPHLGASTREAQDKAGITVAEMVRLALKGEFVPYAVNVSAGAEVTEVVRPFVPLAEHLGGLAAGLACGRGADRRRVLPRADRGARYARADPRRVERHPRSIGERAGDVRERADRSPATAGVTVSEMRSTVSQDYVSLISIRAETDEGPVSVQGTIVARDSVRVLGIDDFDVEVGPAERMVFFRYVDRPGIIGKVGTIFGDAGINIATMDVGRRAQGGEALMVLTVDSEVPQSVLDTVQRAIEATNIRGRLLRVTNVTLRCARPGRSPRGSLLGEMERMVITAGDTGAV